ncbi:MarR family transcriptional regulator [Jatrophihabitans telluris]|uniref:MarR family transcriptional regulator n=1 Tax=Jatrophihabitans telluris TaxID=2038343 RepID=A0ABY4R0P1_9ACTN|nr:MarR family transcriptional regulator [Jatrophihabitans telluris]UQX89324.1 MarR family transcriptional regulator [Jatrophihabitans telluris]
MARRPRPAGLDTEHASAEQSTGLLLWQVTNRWQAEQRAALKPFDLTHVQFVLLASLTYLEARAGGSPNRPVSQRRLADHAATDPMMTSQVLRALEVRGLVERAEHPDDKRARAVRATTAGASLANRAVREVEACDRRFFAPLGPAVTGFTGALRTLRQGAPDAGKT